MSHELSIRANGFVEFAYAQADGEAWHGLGQAVPAGATIEQWQAASGMDYKIQRSKVRFATAHGQAGAEYIEVPDQHVLFRSDNKHPLGIVSAKYQVVQPKEVVEFFRDIAKVNGLELSAAGVIYEGKRYWATAKLGEASPVSVKDKIGGYLLISTSADGSLATEVRFTTIRVVCRNTLQMAREEAAAIRITHRSKFDSVKIKKQLGLADDAWLNFRHTMTRLANVQIVDEQAREIVSSLFRKVDTDAVEQATAAIVAAKNSAKTERDPAGYTKIMDLFRGQAIGSQLDGVRGTAYGLLNATTEYVDHHARAASVDNRFVSAQWGKGNDLKADMLAKLVALV